VLKGKWNRFLILLAAEVLLVIILLPGCFRREKMEGVYFGEDMQETGQWVDGHLEICSSSLTLMPGVYQVRIWSDLPEGQGLYVYMGCEHAYFKTMRNNGMAISPGNNYDDFDVFVLDKVPAAYVQCNLFGAEPGTVVRLEVWKTNQGSRMLLLLVLAGCAAVDFLVVFRRRILEGRVTARQQVVFWTLTAGVLLACFPYLTDYIIRGDDSMFHLSRIAYLADSLRAGSMFPVRVQGTWASGHGYAVSLFYSDFFLYLPALLRLTGFSIMTSYKIFVFLVTAATAAIAYFSFRKCVKDEYGALFGSMIYLLAPYRMYNVYSRGAVGEFLAMAFLPLVCCGVYLLYTGDVTSGEYKRYKWYVIWGMSALLQSHLISTEIMAFLLVLVGTAFWKKTFRKQTFLQFAEAVGIALLINAWFWAPLLYMMNCDAYYMQGLVQSDVQLSGLSLANFFYWLPHSNYRVESMIRVWAGAGVILLLLFYGLWQYRRRKRDVVCRVLVVFIVMGLVMSVKFFPWNAIIKLPGIGFVAASLQFPWRWLSAVNLFSALLGAFFFRQVSEEGGRAARAAVGVLALFTILSAVYHVNNIVFEAEPVFLYNEENMGTGNVASGEYLLAGMELSDLYYHDPVAEEGLSWSNYEKKGTNITVLLENTADKIRYFDVPLIGYKGYGVRASDAEDGGPYVAEERGEHGDLRLAVPAGYRGTVCISYEGTVLFHLAEAVSLLALGSLAGIFAYTKLHRRVTA